MSTALEINGVSFVSIKEAATLVNYSRDYVARLAREKKIVATQVVRQWYVDPVSLKSFAETASLEQEVRKRQLSLHRRREQVVRQEAKSLRSGMTKRLQARVSRARVLASFVLFVGLAAGTLSYVEYGSILGTSQTFLSELVRVSTGKDLVRINEVEAMEGKVTKAVPQATPVAVYSTVEDKPQYEDSSSVTVIEEGDLSGIFLMTNEGGKPNTDEVAEVFSDEVEVRFTSPNEGVVVYEPVVGEVREFPFVSVPVTTPSASSTTVF